MPRPAAGGEGDGGNGDEEAAPRHARPPSKPHAREWPRGSGWFASVAASSDRFRIGGAPTRRRGPPVGEPTSRGRRRPRAARRRPRGPRPPGGEPTGGGPGAPPGAPPPAARAAPIAAHTTRFAGAAGRGVDHVH